MSTGVRIIGGQWRGRKLAVPNAEGLRPTPNRVRETLFNWLMHDIAGAVVLDAFAGSGALGFEALSRGAAEVTLVESQAHILAHLRKTGALFHTEQIHYLHADFPCKIAKKFNIVFLDPPFHQNLLMSVCHFLENQAMLADDALIYMECEAEHAPMPLPAHWQKLKSKTAGEVRYELWQAISS